MARGSGAADPWGARRRSSSPGATRRTSSLALRPTSPAAGRGAGAFLAKVKGTPPAFGQRATLWGRPHSLHRCRLFGGKGVIVAGQDAAGHCEDAVPVPVKLLSVVRDHSQDPILMVAAKKRVAGDHRRLATVRDNHGKVSRYVAGGHMRVEPFGQAAILNPDELLRRSHPLAVPHPQAEFSQLAHQLTSPLVVKGFGVILEHELFPVEVVFEIGIERTAPIIRT